MCSDAKERMGSEKLREATVPIQSLVKLQPWFLSLQWKTCHRQNYNLGSCACSKGPAFGQNTDDNDDDDSCLTRARNGACRCVGYCDYFRSEVIRSYRNFTWLKSHRNPKALSEICGEFTVARTKISRWANRFRGDSVSIDNDPR